jgi:hypothetical protein
MGAAACVCALAFAFSSEIMDQYDGETSRITDVRPGYWLWLASIGLATLASLFANRTADAEEQLRQRVEGAFSDEPAARDG